MTFALFALVIIIVASAILLGGAAILRETSEHEHG